MSNLEKLAESNQSIWLNYLRRAFIESGELRDYIEGGIQGITSSPRVIEKAISCSADYDKVIRRKIAAGESIEHIYLSLIVDDVQRTADMLHGIFERSDGVDGYVTIELSPALAHDATGTVAEVRHLLHLVNRVNVMVEIPATPAGIGAIQALTADGVNVNATHVYSVDVYEQVAMAYFAGLDQYLESHSVWRLTPASVVSVSISRIDTAVDRVLAGQGRSELMGKTGIATAKLIYQRCGEIFSGSRWASLVRKGARAQRPKWTRTAPTDFRYADTYYVNQLVAPRTVVTVTPVTYNAFRDHGGVEASLADDVNEAEAYFDALTQAGVDLLSITETLQAESLAAFSRYHHSLIASVRRKRNQLEDAWHRMVPCLGSEATLLEKATEELCNERVLARIWAHDHTVWKPEPAEITDRLGWLHVIDTMEENLGRLHSLLHDVREAGYGQALLLGMGGSSLAAELFYSTFGKPSLPSYADYPYLELQVLDTTDPDAIRAAVAKLELARTLFLVSSKSGTTVETISAFKYFYKLTVDALGDAQAGPHFVAITDPGTHLAKVARRLGFRELFLNDPHIGGRYSALSYFGLVPAVLVGVDLETLLDRGQMMVCNASSCNCPLERDNLAAQLGSLVGALARRDRQPRDKITFLISPAIRAFGDWVEQLIAESTGKEGSGILPVIGEPVIPPGDYGEDRLFVHVRLDGDGTWDQVSDALIDAGKPVVTLRLQDRYDVGGLFFLWEMATAVAAYHVGINPFDQPNVESAKQLARELLVSYRETGQLPEEAFSPLQPGQLHDFVAKATPDAYISLHAYVPPSPETDRALQALRGKLLERYRLATTVGYGPRLLHSTGQLHKGDAGHGLFIQFVSDASEDLAIPGETGEAEAAVSFGILKRAQAWGDAQALRKAGRPVLRFRLGTDVLAGIDQLLQEVPAVA